MRAIIITLSIIVYMSCTEVVEYIPEVQSYAEANIDDWSILKDVKCEWLILTGTNISDSDLIHLESVSGLRKLSIDNCDNITSFEGLLGLNIEWLDVDSCDGVDSLPFGSMRSLRHLESAYCWKVEKNHYKAFKFADSLPNLEYLSIGMMGYCMDTSVHLPLIDTIVGGSVDDSAYYVDNGVVFISETREAIKWYDSNKGK